MKKKGKSGGLFPALLSTMFMVVYAWLVMGSTSECFYSEGSPNSPGLMGLYSKDDIMDFFSSRTGAQLECYSTFLKWSDSIFPLVYGLMYLFWLQYFFPSFRFLFFLPLLHVVMDWSENFLELSMLDQFVLTADVNDAVVQVASVISLLKWLLSGLTYLLILLGVLKRCKDFFREKKAVR